MRRDQVRQHCRNHADAQRAANIRLQRSNLRGRLLRLPENLLGIWVKHSAGMSQADGTALANEEIGADRLFQASNLLRQRGLRDALLFCGLGEAAGLDNSAEVAKLMKFHLCFNDITR